MATFNRDNNPDTSTTLTSVNEVEVSPEMDQLQQELDALPPLQELEHLTRTERLRDSLEALNFGEKGERLEFIQDQHFKPLVDSVSLFGPEGIDIRALAPGAVAGVQRLLRETGREVPYTGTVDDETLAALEEYAGSSTVTAGTVSALVNDYKRLQGVGLDDSFETSISEYPSFKIQIGPEVTLEGEFEKAFGGELTQSEREAFDLLGDSLEAQLRVLEQYRYSTTRDQERLERLVQNELGNSLF